MWNLRFKKVSWKYAIFLKYTYKIVIKYTHTEILSTMIFRYRKVTNYDFCPIEETSTIIFSYIRVINDYLFVENIYQWWIFRIGRSSNIVPYRKFINLIFRFSYRKVINDDLRTEISTIIFSLGRSFPIKKITSIIFRYRKITNYDSPPL